MSLHVQLSPEALARLKAQQRNSTITSIIISILVVLLICIVLLFLLLPRVENFTPEIVSYQGNIEEEQKVEKREINRSIQREPSAPSSSLAKVIAANTTSQIAIPVTESYVDTPSLDFGDGDDFGIGDGFGSGGEGEGNGGGFGSTTKLLGTIKGRLYDFKQNPKGKSTSYDVKKREDFTSAVKRLHQRKYSQSILDRYYGAKQPLYIRYIAIPNSNADEGPRFFKAEKEIKPSGWIAHYDGKVVAPKDGTFRFVGAADDYLSVIIDNNFKLIAAWPDIQKTVSVRGANSKEQPTDKPGPFRDSVPVTHGEWFTVKKGQVMDIAITVGERPGGHVGFLLLIEEQGVKYRKTSRQTILPPFAMGELTDDDLKNLKKFDGWRIETKNVPIFQAK